MHVLRVCSFQQLITEIRVNMSHWLGRTKSPEISKHISLVRAGDTTCGRDVLLSASCCCRGLNALETAVVLPVPQKVTGGTSCCCPEPPYFALSGEVGWEWCKEGTTHPGSCSAPHQHWLCLCKGRAWLIPPLKWCFCVCVSMCPCVSSWKKHFCLGTSVGRFPFSFPTALRNAGGHRDLPKGFRSEILFPRIISSGSQAI